MLTLSKQAILAAVQLISKGSLDLPAEAIVDALIARDLVQRVGDRLELTQFGKSYARSAYTPAWH